MAGQGQFGGFNLIGPAAPEIGKVIAGMAVAQAAGEATKWALENAAGYTAEQGEAPIPQQTSNELINKIAFHPVINITPQMRNDLIEASHVIQDAGDANALQTKLMDDLDFGSPPVAERLQGQAPEQAAALNEIVEGIDPRPLMGAEDKAIVKKLRRKPTDGYYCSTEYHEWKYHVTKEWTDLLSAWDLQYTGGNPTGYPTYGEWVDSKPFRKLVELDRAIDRSLTGKGFKRLLTLLGTTKATEKDNVIATQASQDVKDAAVADASWLANN